MSIARTQPVPIIGLVFSLIVSTSARGETPAEPIHLGVGSQPQITIDDEGHAFVVFVRDKSIWLCVSRDQGATFGEPKRVDTPPSMPAGARRGPRIAATGKAIVISAISRSRDGGKDGDLFVWRSLDKGRSWKNHDETLNSVRSAAREGLHGMAAGPNGLVVCVWLDMRNAKPKTGGTEIWCAVSTDGGDTWGNDRRVYQSPERTVCECCHPSVAIDADGRIFVMFRNALEGARDMYFSVSENGGETFAEAVKLGEHSWSIDACPMDGGALAVRSGKITTIWRRRLQVYTATPDAAEVEIGKGTQPIICATDDGLYYLWTDRAELMIRTAEKPKPRSLASNAAYPSIAAGHGANSLVVAVWQEHDAVVACRLASMK